MSVSTRSRLWLPFTQMAAFDACERTFVRASGAYLFDARGRRIFDAISSVWTNVHGHCHPHIVERIAEQASILDHATLLGATNPVAEALAARLAEICGLQYAFFASDGASAIEAALKMALQFWQNAGEPQRTRFVRLRSAYHGDTAGAMSVSDIRLFKERFGAITFESRAFEESDAARGDDVAAVIVEPLVQAAAGMQLASRAQHEALSGMTPLLVVDEIATGFGRTGTMFAFEQTALRPDIVCVGKGLTGGTLPLSATVVADRIYAAFLGAAHEHRQFFHGHSYAGNPIACAAALASLELFERERTLERVAGLAECWSRQARSLQLLDGIREVRSCGLMSGIELRTERLAASDAATPAWRVAAGLYERGFFTRPIGETVQFVPPLCSTPKELEGFARALAAVIA